MRIALGLSMCMVLVAPLAGAAGITVVNLDSGGEGFNDATATTSPITGSPSTLGADRLACFNAAADVWETILAIDVEIRVGANFDPLGGTVMGGTPLGAAGPEVSARDFTGAPQSSTWYTVAQANQHFGSDLDPGFNDVGAVFNSDVDDPTEVPGFSWYYGIDGSPPGGTIDFFSTVMHEIGHGIGFLSLVSTSTGAKSGGFNDIYSDQLQHGGSGGDTAFNSLSNAGRVTAFTSVSELEWIGSFSVGSGTYNASGDPVLMYAPASVETGSTLSHWDTTNSPNLLMEPFATDPFTDLTLELAAFRDMGWPLALDPDLLYVDVDHTGTEAGTAGNPFDALRQAVNTANDNADINIEPGSYTETFSGGSAIDKPLTLSNGTPAGGDVVLGASARNANRDRQPDSGFVNP